MKSSGHRSSLSAILAFLLVVCMAVPQLAQSATSPASVNVAAQSNGGVASASSSYSACCNFGPPGANDGDRKGLNWGNGGGWNDNTANSYPDILQINFDTFSGFMISEIDVFTLQDNFATPIDPTSSMTFTQYGITDFQVQYWNFGTWVDVPGGNVTGNNLVWRRFTFAPINTTAIRVLVNSALASYSRIVEVEAWTAASGTNAPPTITLTSPANNAMFNAPATVNLSATAADSDGTVTKVEFYRDSILIATVTTPSSGTQSSGTWTYSDPNLAVGNYSYTAKVYDNASPSAVTTSQPALLSVTATNAASVNVAAQSNGGVASASSTYSACCNFGPAGANNGDRKGLNWGNGGGWNDDTANSYFDWLQITFNGIKTIGEIDVFTLQDNFAAPVDPTPSMTFFQYGITSFLVQYWNGSDWVDVPRGFVSENNMVWRRIAFAPISTSAIRVLVTSALQGYSRIVEVEAWTTTISGTNAPPTITLNAPANNTMLTAPATVNLSATAADSDGAVSKVEFFRDTTLIATVTTPSSGMASSGTWTSSDTSVPVGNYTYTAKVYDNAAPSAITTSAAALVSVTAPPPTPVNVAAQSNGGVASASSTYSACCDFGAAGANNGDRKGLNWGSGGGWNDSTANNYPDWLQIDFSGMQSISEIDIFSVQDNFATPVEPTSSMTFTQYGITAFQVQYRNGSAWVDVPGGNVTGNNLVWRRFAFAPIITNAIRVLVNASLNGYSRIVEVEAWTTSGGGPPPSIALQSVASGLLNPVGIEKAGDSSGRLFVVQQGGQIKILSGGAVLPTPFLDIAPLIVSGGEQGLLGVAFHPNYAANGFFYVNYTRQNDGATVIARYQRSASDPNIADPNSASILLTVAQPFVNHNGGQLRFGLDGYLYIGLGDGGSANDPGNRAQDLSTLLGKMLRIDVNSGSPYAIPASNPFQSDGNPNTLGEIWAYGLRNPWRFSFDRSTADLFIADVGQSAFEEINFQPAGSGAGANYGWRVMEGAHCTGLGGGPACFDASLTLPILEYGHDVGCSITGGHRYRGSASPALAGFFVYGDFCSGRIWGATKSASGAWTTNELLSAGFNISTFGEDEAGEIYVAAYNTGAIYHVVGH